jgi:hypothetical protein
MTPIPTLTITFTPDAPMRVELSAPIADEKIDPARRLFAAWEKQWRELAGIPTLFAP